MPEIMPEAVVCIPSFRRPEGLRKTLLSLAARSQASGHRAIPDYAPSSSAT